MAGLTIREAGPDDEPGILALAAESLGWGDDERFRALYRWKHDENVFGPSFRWVAADGDRIVGFRTMMRWRFRRPGRRPLAAVRAVDTATAPSHQGQGIFRSLTTLAVEDLRARGVGFVFNTPNDQSRPGYLKMGWVELGRPTVAIAPRLRSLPRIAGSRTAAELWSLPCDLGEDARSFFADPDPRCSPLWEDRSERWAVERSVEWCRWRFGLDPLRYRVLTTDHLGRGDRGGRGGGHGALVFRLRRRGAATEATVALLAAGGSARRRLLRALLDHADHALVAGGRRVDATPAVTSRALSPLVTWRALAEPGPMPLADLDLQVGDLELF